MPLKTKEQFIQDAKRVHGNRYDYKNVVYTGANVKVDIICEKHGTFKQSPSKHILGRGCPKCKVDRIKEGIAARSKQKIEEGLKELVQPEDHKLVPLTGGWVVKVSNEDFDRVIQYVWCNRSSKKDIRAYNVVAGEMHRFIMGLTKEDKDRVVDHIDHDTLNNQRSNLRICTPQENSMNQSLQKGRTSRFKGVHFNTKRRRWVSSIKLDGKTTCLGLYSDEIEAAKRYDEEAVKLFGEFAFLNFND